jgi:hypothetical protein
MMENQKDYSDYIRHRSNVFHVLILFCGFTFTTITLLITLLPHLGGFLVQCTLFYLAVLLGLFLLLIEYNLAYVPMYCKDLPPLTVGQRIFNNLFHVCQMLWLGGVVLMFLISDLPFLAIITAAAYVLIAVIAYIFIWKRIVVDQLKFRQQHGG